MDKRPTNLHPKHEADNTFGFIRVAAAVPELRVADCMYNVARIGALIEKAASKGVQVVCFPELSITSYSCADLFFQKSLLNNAVLALKTLMNQTASLNIISIVGMPVEHNSRLYNAAVIFKQKEILAVVPKKHLPNNNEFYEKRWFSGGSSLGNDNIPIYLAGQHTLLAPASIIRTDDFAFGVELCEDLWAPIPKSAQMAVNGAEIIFNLSASNELVGKHAYRRQLIEQQSARCHCGYVYASAGHGESTTDLVFGGYAAVAENGVVLAEGNRFQLDSQLVITEIDLDRIRIERMKQTNFFTEREAKDQPIVCSVRLPLQPEKWTLTRPIDPHPFVPPIIAKRNESCEEIIAIQSSGLAKRWQHTQADKLVVGISGGLDSTLALLVCVRTADKLGFDRKRILGITMPGFGTTGRTHNNALELMKSLGVSPLEIDIKAACLQHFEDIGHNPDIHDVTYENVQARERTQILMDMANKHNGLVVGTGDLSEMALGWSTYNGDHMAMYNVNSSVPKTLVRLLVGWCAEQLDKQTGEVLRDVLNTPVSPELVPGDEKGEIRQKTEDIVGPYELHDFFLYYFVRFGFTPAKISFLAQQAFGEQYTPQTIDKWLDIFLKRFFRQQFKRSCSPDSPKVGSVNLSPRGDWRMPSDAQYADRHPLTKT